MITRTVKYNLSNNAKSYKPREESFRKQDLISLSDRWRDSSYTIENNNLPMVCNPYIFLSDNSKKDIFEGINKKYLKEFLSLISKYKNPDSQALGLEILKLSNECNKELVHCAEANNIQHIPFLQISTKDLKETSNFVDKMFETIEKNKREFRL